MSRLNNKESRSKYRGDSRALDASKRTFSSSDKVNNDLMLELYYLAYDHLPKSMDKRALENKAADISYKMMECFDKETRRGVSIPVASVSPEFYGNA